MRKSVVVLALTSSVVAATLPSSFEMDLGVGYRQDSVKYHFRRIDTNFPIDVYRVNSDPLRGIALFGFGEANLRKFIVRVEGDYTWIVSGKTDLTTFIPENEGATSSGVVPVYQKAHNRGYVFDVLGSAGYRFTCYESPSTNFSITPRGGYGTCRYHIKMQDESPQPAFGDMTKSSLVGTSVAVIQDAGVAKIDWYGSFIAGDFILRFAEMFRISATYAYHWLDMKFRQAPFFDITVTNPMGTGGFLTTQMVRFKVEDAWSHQIQGRFSYLIDSCWTVGLFGQYQMLGVKRSKIKSPSESVEVQTGQVTRVNETDLFKINTQTFLIGAEASYTF